MGKNGHGRRTKGSFKPCGGHIVDENFPGELGASLVELYAELVPGL